MQMIKAIVYSDEREYMIMQDDGRFFPVPLQTAIVTALEGADAMNYRPVKYFAGYENDTATPEQAKQAATAAAAILEANPAIMEIAKASDDMLVNAEIEAAHRQIIALLN